MSGHVGLKNSRDITWNRLYKSSHLHGMPNYSHLSYRQHIDFALHKLMKHTNLKIKHAACLHIAHILHHATFRPTQQSTQTTMVNAPKKNFRHFQRANMANQQSVPHDDIIRRMKPSVAWRQKESEPLGHCAACEPKEACGGEPTGNADMMQWSGRTMDGGLCWESNRCRKEQSCSRRDSD